MDIGGDITTVVSNVRHINRDLIVFKNDVVKSFKETMHYIETAIGDNNKVLVSFIAEAWASEGNKEGKLAFTTKLNSKAKELNLFQEKMDAFNTGEQSITLSSNYSYSYSTTRVGVGTRVVLEWYSSRTP